MKRGQPSKSVHASVAGDKALRRLDTLFKSVVSVSNKDVQERITADKNKRLVRRKSPQLP